MLRAAPHAPNKRPAPSVQSRGFYPRSRSTARLKLAIEVLEPRMLLSTDTWINPAGGDWGTPGNWSSNALPGPNDDVVINGLNPGAIVSHAQNVTDTIESPTAAAPITLSHGTLDLSGGTATAGAMSYSSPFSPAGGTLSLADVQAGTALTATSSFGRTLHRLTLGGTLSVSNTGIAVIGGLTLANGAQATLGDANLGCEMDFQGDQTVGGTGTLTLGGPGATLNIHADVILGPGITVHGTGGFVDTVAGSLLNQGTIASDGGGSITFLGNPGTWAIALVEPLFAKLLPREEVLDALRHNTALSEPVRTQALILAERHRVNAMSLNGASWRVVRLPGAEAAAYRLALRRAEAACQDSPHNGTLLKTLGVAQYRVGQFQEAVVTLTRADELNSVAPGGSSPADLAFLAMAQHRLGQTEKARAALSRLREAMRKPQWAQDPESRGPEAGTQLGGQKRGCSPDHKLIASFFSRMAKLAGGTGAPSP